MGSEGVDFQIMWIMNRAMHVNDIVLNILLHVNTTLKSVMVVNVLWMSSFPRSSPKALCELTLNTVAMRGLESFLALLSVPSSRDERGTVMHHSDRQNIRDTISWNETQFHELLTNWRLVPSILGMGSVGNVCYSINQIIFEQQVKKHLQFHWFHTKSSKEQS